MNAARPPYVVLGVLLAIQVLIVGLAFDPAPSYLHFSPPITMALSFSSCLAAGGPDDVNNQGRPYRIAWPYKDTFMASQSTLMPWPRTELTLRLSCSTCMISCCVAIRTRARVELCVLLLGGHHGAYG